MTAVQAEATMLIRQQIHQEQVALGAGTEGQDRGPRGVIFEQPANDILIFEYRSGGGTPIADQEYQVWALRIGMAQDETRDIMGDPERSEGYEWGTAWLYRTAMTSGIYGTADSDFTPIVFHPDGKVIGWGRNFFTEHVRRYEVRLRTD